MDGPRQDHTDKTRSTEMLLLARVVCIRFDIVWETGDKEEPAIQANGTPSRWNRLPWSVPETRRSSCPMCWRRQGKWKKPLESGRGTADERMDEMDGWMDGEVATSNKESEET